MAREARFRIYNSKKEFIRLGSLMLLSLSLFLKLKLLLLPTERFGTHGSSPNHEGPFLLLEETTAHRTTIKLMLLADRITTSQMELGRA